MKMLGRFGTPRLPGWLLPTTRRAEPATTEGASLPGPIVRAAGWTVVGLSLFLFLVYPLSKGRFYGFGQVLYSCLLIVFSAWLLHWTHRRVWVDGARVVLDSPVHSRTLPIRGLRVEIRRGWWTRIVLIPASGLSTSLLRPLWGPDPEEILRGHLPPGAISTESSPGLEDPGPEERE